MHQKKILLFILLICFAFVAQARQDTLSVSVVPTDSAFSLSGLFTDSVSAHRPYYAIKYDTIPIKKIDITLSEYSKFNQTRKEYTQLRPPMSQKWLFYLILSLAIIVVFVKSIFTRFFNELIRSFFKLSNSLQMMRQQDLAFSVPGILLSINFYVAGGTLLFLYLNPPHTTFANQFKLIATLVGCIMSFVVFRFLLYRFSMLFFNKKTEIETISFIDLLQLEFLGIVLVPMVLILGFGNTTITQIMWPTCYIMLIVIAFFRLFNGWRIGGHLMFGNIFHFILYICSVEIAPVLIILKLIKKWAVLN